MVPCASRTWSKNSPMVSSGRAGTITCSPAALVSEASLRKSLLRRACRTACVTTSRARDLPSTSPPSLVLFPTGYQHCLPLAPPAVNILRPVYREQGLLGYLRPIYRQDVKVHLLMARVDPRDIMPPAAGLDLRGDCELDKAPGFLVQPLTSDDAPET